MEGAARAEVGSGAVGWGVVARVGEGRVGVAMVVAATAEGMVEAGLAGEGSVEAGLVVAG